jgi:hypothetical protein
MSIINLEGVGVGRGRSISVDCTQREPVSRQDLIDMSLKLQEALSLITQALSRKEN